MPTGGTSEERLMTFSINGTIYLCWPWSEIIEIIGAGWKLLRQCSLYNSRGNANCTYPKRNLEMTIKSIWFSDLGIILLAVISRVGKYKGFPIFSSTLCLDEATIFALCMGPVLYLWEPNHESKGRAGEWNTNLLSLIWSSGDGQCTRGRITGHLDERLLMN